MTFPFSKSNGNARKQHETIAGYPVCKAFGSFHSLELNANVMRLSEMAKMKMHLGKRPKPFVSYNGHAMFAELAILKILRKRGWNGVWVSSWGGISFWCDMNKKVDLEKTYPNMYRLFTAISFVKGGARGGCWDVFAWRGKKRKRILFIESKRGGGKDSIRPSQVEWLKATLKLGRILSDRFVISPASFIIYEWDIR